MRKYGHFLKNFAAICMLIALLSLLLPFCKIETNSTTCTLSGIDIIHMSYTVTRQYIKTGAVNPDTELKAGVTVNDLENFYLAVKSNGMMKELGVACFICLLPMFLCILAFFCTLLAEGKKTMVFPTLCILIAFVEYLAFIMYFGQLPNHAISFISSGSSSASQYFTPLAGLYLFTLLCGIAFVFIMLGWITGGYRKPKRSTGLGRKHKYSRKKTDYSNDDEYDNPYDDNSADDSKNNDNSDKNSKKNRDNQKDKSGSDDKKHKRSNNRSKDKNKSKKNSKKDNSDNKSDKKNSSKDSSDINVPIASGLLGNGTGLYQDINIDLSSASGHSVTIGTTLNAVRSLSTGSMSQLDAIANANCVISYLPSSHMYQIISHSDIPLTLFENGSGININNGSIHNFGAGSMLSTIDSKSTLSFN